MAVKVMKTYFRKFKSKIMSYSKYKNFIYDTLTRKKLGSEKSSH